MKKILMILCSLVSPAKAQEVINLYPDTIPNVTDKDQVLLEKNIPKLFVYTPAESAAKNIAVLVIPGGGYAHIAMDHEGHAVANELVRNGYSAYVLQYRLPSPNIMRDKSIGPLQDAQRAVQLIRASNPQIKKVGVIGFSAGGHLASTLVTKFKKEYISNPSHVSLRPDFAGLIYPVISMQNDVTHKGSKINLIGENPPEELVHLFSSDLQVSPEVCPVFFVHAKDDKSVPIENSYRMMAALDKVHVPNTLYVFEQGGHGFGLINKTSEKKWFDSFLSWVSTLN
ncbi:alpha/beta hydrolase [Sphingobacterium sp. BIGb0165]|uniref:alpha/beta hydrolase n=1 Tax=Sphingobacterium sp. BIGb0165 TaxID=2940615 RepID=UPI002166D29A|nr:alpha/beta hydrolase [Sphingobacterium sp. BIGb0165]MCS4228409.1 acetyl esterase/lipase [Sphingobacterium sp. BIGb0165]